MFQNLTKRISTPIGILIIVIFAILAGGFAIWQKQKVEEGILFIDEYFNIEKSATKNIKISFSIVSDEEKLKNFLIDQKINNDRAGFLSFHSIKKDLNKDGIEEIIVSISYGGPSMGWIGLLVKDDFKEEYELVNWESTRGYVYAEKIQFKNIPNEKYLSIIVETGGGCGTGCHVHEMNIYTYLHNQLKLTWRGFKEETNISFEGITNNYEIDFEDINNDGNSEIVQAGKEEKVKWDTEKQDYITTKEIAVKYIYEWNEQKQEFIEKAK